MTNHPLLLDDIAWHAEAACRDLPHSWWFPNVGGGTDPNAAKARIICRTCPVRKDCAQWARKHNPPYGIWGGYGYKTRRALDLADVPI